MVEILTMTVQFTHMGERPLRNTNAKWLVDFSLQQLPRTRISQHHDAHIQPLVSDTKSWIKSKSGPIHSNILNKVTKYFY